MSVGEFCGGKEGEEVLDVIDDVKGRGGEDEAVISADEEDVIFQAGV